MRIKVSNFPVGTTEEDLHKVFEPFGKIRGTIFVENPSGEPMALIEMPFDTEAMRAIIRLNWREFKGQKIRVQQAPESRKRAPVRPLF